MRLRWFGHTERRTKEHITQKCQQIEVEGSRPRGRPKATWNSSVQQDLKKIGARKEEAEDRTLWRTLIAMSALTSGSSGEK